MRLIRNYDPDSITMEFLNSFDWDLIELNKTINADRMLLWYNTIEENLSELKFNFRKNLDLIQNKISQKFLTDSVGGFFDATREEFEGIYSYSLKWICQRKDPLPPPWAVDIEIFKELKDYRDSNGLINVDYENFYSKTKYLEWYLFGEFSNIVKNWGDKIFYNPRISIHDLRIKIRAHTDNAYIGRMHIPITIDNSLFCFGENLERQYKLKPGHIYFFNSRIIHGTINGESIRANLMSDIVPGKELDLIRL